MKVLDNKFSKQSCINYHNIIVNGIDYELNIAKLSSFHTRRAENSDVSVRIQFELNIAKLSSVLVEAGG